jgi:hypothetical protein
MHQPSFRGVVAALSRKAPELGLGAALFAARLLIAFALPSLGLAHKAHTSAKPATAAYSRQPTQKASRHFTGVRGQFAMAATTSQPSMS